jgi:transposase
MLGKHSTRQRGLTVVTRRWVVERTIAWLTQHRRLSEDEEQVSSSEAMIYIAMIRPMVRRLARSTPSSASF